MLCLVLAPWSLWSFSPWYSAQLMWHSWCTSGVWRTSTTCPMLLWWVTNSLKKNLRQRTRTRHRMRKTLRIKLRSRRKNVGGALSKEMKRMMIRMKMRRWIMTRVAPLSKGLKRHRQQLRNPKTKLSSKLQTGSRNAWSHLLSHQESVVRLGTTRLNSRSLSHSPRRMTFVTPLPWMVASSLRRPL